MILIFTGKLHISSSSAGQKLPFSQMFLRPAGSCIGRNADAWATFSGIAEGLFIAWFEVPCFAIRCHFRCHVWWFLDATLWRFDLIQAFQKWRVQKDLYLANSLVAGCNSTCTVKESMMEDRRIFSEIQGSHSEWLGLRESCFMLLSCSLYISYSELAVVKWLLDVLMQGGCCTTILLYYHTA